MKNLIYFAALFISFVACTNDTVIDDKGLGTLLLQLQAEDCPVTITKATALPNVDDFKIRVKAEEGAYDKTFTSYATLKNESPLFLEAGSYTVTAYSNEYEEQVLGKPCFMASTSLTIVENQISPVDLICTLQQIMISFKCSDEFLSSFKNSEDNPFVLTVTDSNNHSMTVPYEKLNESVYFAPGAAFIKLNLRATTVKGFPVNFTETIQKNDKSHLKAKDHITLKLEVKEADTKSVLLKSEIR